MTPPELSIEYLPDKGALTTFVNGTEQYVNGEVWWQAWGDEDCNFNLTSFLWAACSNGSILLN